MEQRRGSHREDREERGILCSWRQRIDGELWRDKKLANAADEEALDLVWALLGA